MIEHSIPLTPIHEQREQVIDSTRFCDNLSTLGWTVTRMRQSYTDPDVFRQQWLVCPHGTVYPEHTFYRLFGETCFRKLLRYMLIHAPCETQTLWPLCPQHEQLSTYLTFLHDQGWFQWHNKSFLRRTTYQEQISNIGRTLEWYVAQWFRLNYSEIQLIQVRHGVELAEMPLPGDLDVVALLNDSLTVLVECKSSSGTVEEADYGRFLQRVQAFQPNIAILLIDTAAPFSSGKISAFNMALEQFGLAPLAGNGGFYRGPMNIYLVNVAHSLAISLRYTLQFHEYYKNISRRG